MKLLVHTLCLCLALGLALAAPMDDPEPQAENEDLGDVHSHGHGHNVHGDHTHDDEMDRCKGMEMDAATVDENGVPFFFKGDHLFQGFHGRSKWSNESFPEMDKAHDLDHVDAAFRMDHKERNDHDHMFLFLDDKVFSFHKHKLEDGYPKMIEDVFPGVPEHLDAAVGCPAPDCADDSVLFFKANDVFNFNVKTKALEKKDFEKMPNCTSAFRFMENYYCFHAHMFTKFNPQTGDVMENYPKEARNFFMRCSDFGSDADHSERERCSRVHLDAVTSDHNGQVYVFRGHHFSRKDENATVFSADAIDSAFKEVHADVDAVFTFEDKLHMIKGDEVFIYADEAPHALVDDKSKSLKEVLGMDGPVDAAFVCDDDHDDIVHVIKDNHLYDVNLKAAVPAPENERTLGLFRNIDAAKCDKTGVKLFTANHFFHFNSLAEMALAKALPQEQRVSVDLFGCDH